MNRNVWGFLLLLVVFASVLSAQSEEAAVRQVIEKAYVEGIHNGGSLEAVERGFHPSFVLPGIGADGSTVTLLPIYTWMEMIRQRKAEGKPVPGPTECRFLQVDVTGTAAMAKIELVRDGKAIFTDYLGLYKFREGWRIVNKIYHRH